MSDRSPGTPGLPAPSFDEWVEARLAPLVRFAYLVTGSQHAADDAVQTALAQACARWSRVGHTDDPDVYVRRMVVNAHVSAWRRSGRRELSVPEVRDGASGLDPADDVARDDAVWRVCLALPPQQRAAVVLRFYEDLDYPEIARVLDVAEGDRALTRPPRAGGAAPRAHRRPREHEGALMDDDELEQAMRAGLTNRAARVGVDPLVVARARSDARGRRTARAAVLGAAAAVVAVAGVLAVVVDRDEGEAPSAYASPTSSSPSSPSPRALSGEVRTEYWRGARVDVPADWGYGNPTQCGDVPVGEPYVGRPIGISDMCAGFDPTATPTAPYVWFDVDDVPVGTADLGDGWERTTVDVAGVRVSVADDDPAVAAAILATAASGDLCEPTMASSPEPRYDNTVEGAGAFVEARLCAYDQNEEGRYDLVYARILDRRSYEGAVSAVDDAASASSCGRPSYEVVVLTAGYADPYGPDATVALDRDVVYDLGCGVVRVGQPSGRASTSHRVTEATVPWAGPEFRRLLTGPPEAWSYERFIGIQG